MRYSIDKEALYDLVDAEMAHVADEAYTDGGESRYDAVVLTEKDRTTVEQYIDDAAVGILRAIADIASYESSPAEVIVINVPDMDASQEDAAAVALNRYISLYATAELCRRRMPGFAVAYDTQAAASIASAIEILRTRKAPSRT